MDSAPRAPAIQIAPTPKSSSSPGSVASIRAVLDRWADWIALLYCVALTFAVYWRVLGFSFFLDDSFDLTRTETETFRSLLGPLQGYVYYRPIPFMIWKGLRLLEGRYDPVILHLLPVAAHILSGWLLFLLIRRLTGSLWAAVPATVFLLYPFSYQALEILGTLVHTLVTTELLAVVFLWYEGRRLRSPVRLVAAAIIAVLALWTHEYGVAVFPLVAGMEAVFWLRRSIRRPSLWLLVPFLAEVAYLKIWFSLNKPHYDYVTRSDMIHNLGFWLQGFAFPATAQTNWLTSHFGHNPAHVVYALGGAAVLAGLALYALNGKLWWGLLALAASLLGFLPAVPTLTYGYVENGPRLLYIAAPGCAVFWGLLPMLRLPHPRATTIWRGAAVAAAVLALAQGVVFIHRRIVMLEYGSTEAQGIIALGVQHNGGSLLVLNAPSWFAPKTQEYPLGHLGVQIEPSYIGLDRLIYAGSGAHVKVESRALAPNVSGWLYDFEPHGPQPIDHNAVDARLRAGAALVVVDLFHDSLAARVPGTIQPDQPAPTTRSAIYGDSLWLLGTNVQRSGSLVTITTRWYVVKPLPADYMFWTQLRDASGATVVERKDYALRGMSAPRLWRTGDVVEDRLVLDLSGVQNSSGLRVWLGMVSTANGSMLPVSPQDGAPTANGWLQIGHD